MPPGPPTKYKSCSPRHSHSCLLPPALGLMMKSNTPAVSQVMTLRSELIPAEHVLTSAEATGICVLQLLEDASAAALCVAANMSGMVWSCGCSGSGLHAACG
jgi:hypothetical protein